MTNHAGSAYIVNHIQEGKKYVAKKVLLEGLGEREQAGCMMEAGLLKNLNHPNIVGYKESFLGNNNLTIIMEYCEGKSQLHSSQANNTFDVFQSEILLTISSASSRKESSSPSRKSSTGLSRSVWR